jgi:CHASE1-domain containing sensor protein
MDDFEKWDSKFRVYHWLGIAAALLSILLSVSALLFVGWVIVKLMQHFGVI